MTIGLLLPSLVMTPRFAERIFAPKELFLALADGLVARGHRVFVYAAPGTKTRAELIPGNETLAAKDLSSIRLRHRNPEFLQKMEFKLTASEYEIELTARAFAHAQAHGVTLMHSYHDFFAHYLAALIPELPVVYTLHDPTFPAETLEGWRINQYPNDAYVAISQRQAELYQAAGVRILEVVHHGIDPAAFPFGEDAGDFLLFLGRFIPEKGLPDALAVAEATQSRLMLATSDNYLETDYYRQEIAPRLAKLPQVTTQGFLAGEGRNRMLSQAKALLFPINWEEPFGLVMIEAMACGTPIIAYNRGSVPEVVVDGKTGFIVEPGETNPTNPTNATNPTNEEKWVIKKRGVEGLVEAVKRIGEIDRAACRRHVEENFTVEKMVISYEEVYREILGK